MVPSRFPLVRASSPASAVRALLMLTSVALAGCATSQARTYDSPTRVSASSRYEAAPDGAGTVEMEDDGVPVQPPPVARQTLEPDDPSEPYSPNYGRQEAHSDAPARHVDAGRPGREQGPTSEPNPPANFWQRTRLTRGMLAATH